MTSPPRMRRVYNQGSEQKLMSRFIRASVASLLISAMFLLSACQSSEEKAEGYYQSALTLMAAGDEDRALVELRNVFKYNGFHKEARKLYADTEYKRGEIGEAYSQYLRLIEQYPDTVEVRLILAETALTRNDWAEVERHGTAALELAPQDPAVQAIGAALAYRQAILNKNEAAKAAAVVEIRRILDLLPDNKVARRILIDSLVNGADPKAALVEIDTALQQEPDSLEFNMLKVRLLAQIPDMAATGKQLQGMVEKFPDNQPVRAALISWYMSQKDFAGAEAYLRKFAGDATSSPEKHGAVIQLLQSVRGNDAAIAELDRLIAANAGTPNADIYGALRASVHFTMGQKDSAIAEIEAILAQAKPSIETRRIKISLAQMLLATDNRVGARAKIEEVLAEDAGDVEALKLRAGLLIQDDKPNEAIVDLRAALAQAPRDPAIFTMMASAHERSGSQDLMGEQLALAVEASNRAPAESLRYAGFLLKQNRTTVAEAVLEDARSVSPGNVDILNQLAQMWLAEKDWDKVSEAIASLRKIASPDALEAARLLQAAQLRAQGNNDAALSFLQGELDKTGTDITAIAQIIQSQALAGKFAAARTLLDESLAKSPEDVNLLLLNGGLYAVEGKAAEAEAVFRKVMADHPDSEIAPSRLYELLVLNGRGPEATALLEQSVKALPKSGMLQWMLASDYQKTGKIKQAITVYEALYAKDSSNMVIANNLASLLSTSSDDPQDLQRADVMARRLRGSPVPAFQDTYGWIEFRKGNLAEALAILEPAAKGLPKDAAAQVHLGLVYAALGQVEKAKATLSQGLQLAGSDPAAQFETARKTLAELEAPAKSTP